MRNDYERSYDDYIERIPEDTRQVTGQCDYCLDDILEGDDIWQDTDGQYDLRVCSIACMTMFTVKYDIDIDEFIKTEAEAVI